jgi:hypothetical protein
LQRRKTRTRRPELGAVLAAALCLAGCGSGSEHRVAPPPKLPQAVAAALASRSEEVARTLTAGDSCRAASIAQQLQQETIAAINGGQVPAAFQEQLGSTVGDLVSRIRCVPVRNNDDEGRRKGKKKKEHKNNHEKHD